MRFSIWPILTQPWADVVDVAKHAEATGWDGVYVADHFMGDAGGRGRVEMPTLEATAVLAALAAATERVRLGAARARHHLPAPGGAGQVGGDRRPRQRRAARCSASAPAGRRTSTSSTASRSGPPGERIDRFEEALRVLRGCCASRRRRSTARTTGRATPSPSRSRCSRRCRSSSAARATACSAWSPATPTSGTCGRPRSCSPSGRRCSTPRCEKAAATRPTIPRSTQALFFVTDDQAKAADLSARVAPRPAVGGPAGAHRRDRRRRGATSASTSSSSPTSPSAPAPARADAMDALIEQVAPAFR